MTEATASAKKAYAPYSKFHVGAALLVAGKKRIITGGNVENASYGLTICAERAALATAVSAGYRRFKAIAVASSGTKALPRRRERKPVVPCGACLQALAEFCGPDFLVITGKGGSPKEMQIYQLRDLLPHVFRFRK